MIGEVILKNKLFSGESINIEYKVEMPKKSEKYMKTVVAFANGIRKSAGLSLTRRLIHLQLHRMIL